MQTSNEPAKARVASVDALRGFDMMWMVGGQHILEGFRTAGAHPGFLAALAAQFDHSLWVGITFFDLIFPLFIWLVGVSVVFSLTRILESQGKRAAHLRILRRTVLLFILGIIYNGGLTNPWPDVRIAGVLQKISLCYLVTGLLFCHLRLRGLIIAFILIITGYWALMSFVPVPGQPAVSFAPERNLANYLDLHYLPGAKTGGTWDSEGILSTVPAIGSCLLGVFAGMLLAAPSVSSRRKAVYLAAGGAGLIALGYLWGLQFPIIKNIWTSSYVLAAGGYSALMLGLFYYLIDVRRWRTWAQPCIWIGANAITIFFVPNIIPMRDLARRLVGGNVAMLFGAHWGDAFVATVGLVLVFLIARFLYRRRIFLRL